MWVRGCCAGAALELEQGPGALWVWVLGRLNRRHLGGVGEARRRMGYEQQDGLSVESKDYLRKLREFKAGPSGCGYMDAALELERGPGALWVWVRGCCDVAGARAWRSLGVGAWVR